MLYVVLAIFILLGLGAFGLAMRGGSRRAGAGAGARQGEGGVGQHLVTAGIVAMFVFGLAVPAFVLADNGLHKASVAIGGVHLTKDEQKGRELFARTCAVCHTLAAVRSVGRTGPDLDIRVGEQVGTGDGPEAIAQRRALVENAIMEGRARGLGQMPALLYQGKEAEDIAKFVAAVAGH